MAKSIVKATNQTLKQLVIEAIEELGNEADLNFIDVSEVTDMKFLFSDEKTKDFIGDISQWDVSNVDNMWGMFKGCRKFNSDLSRWDVSNVTNMEFMFHGCENFNSDLSKWDVSNVGNMWSMFEGCKMFNSDLSKWNVKKVIMAMHDSYKDFAKYGALEKKNMPVFEPKPVVKDGKKIYFATNKNINKLVINAIKKEGPKVDLNFIDVSLVTDMSGLFSFFSRQEELATSFDGDISEWDVSNVIEMSSMFAGSKFNGDLSKWNVSNVKQMYSMFSRSRFNGDISKWDVSKVESMDEMFAGSQFNGDISGWNVAHVKSHDKFAEKGALEEKNMPKFP